MESFAALKRRTTDLLQSLPQSLPSMPAMKSPRHTLQGTWQKIAVPPIPRSSHSLNVVGGSAYIFGGEAKSREAVSNDMHVINLPFGSAAADCYTIRAAPTKTYKAPPEPEASRPSAEKPVIGSGGEKEKGLEEIPLTSPPPVVPGGGPEKEEDDSVGKQKEPESSEPVKLGDVPAPRLGHATAVIGHRIFLFGGRSGSDMAPLEENGRVWVFDTRSHTWGYLDPAPPAPGVILTPCPAARSHHCAAATDKPRDFAIRRPKRAETWKDWAAGDSAEVGIPQAPIVGHVAEGASDEDEDGYGTVFIHAGCVGADGQRTNDLWAFDVRSKVWTELPAAPGPARAGAAICVSKSRLFRFGGFDGKSELGGQVDFVHLEVDLFDDGASKGEISVHARSGWQSIVQGQGQSGTDEIRADDLLQEWPGNRSAAALHALHVGGGREYLVLAMGERDPSAEGHETAGMFWDDVWAFQVPPLGMTTASIRDAMLQAMGKKTGEGKWTKVQMGPYDDDNDDEMPRQRGWMAAAPMGELEENGIVVWGGVGESNQRFGDGWIFRLG